MLYTLNLAVPHINYITIKIGGKRLTEPGEASIQISACPVQQPNPANDLVSTLYLVGMLRFLRTVAKVKR